MNAPLNAPEKSNTVSECRVPPVHRVGGNRAGGLGVGLEARGEDLKGVPGPCPSVLSNLKQRRLKVALDGGTRPRATTPIFSSMGDGQANAFRWDTSPRAALSVVL